MNEENRITVAVLRNELDHVKDEIVKGIRIDMSDHEDRIRSLEKQKTWQWVGQVILVVASILGIRTGLDP